MWRSAKRAEFEASVREHLPDALKLADRLIRCDASAEDVVQDALLKASKAWRTFRGNSQFKTWFYRIVVNCVRDHQRRARKNEQPLPDVGIDTKQKEPIQSLQSAEFQTVMNDALNQLPQRQREVIVLSTIELMSTDEIAAALEMSPANVYSTLHNARKRLKTILQPYIATS